MACNKATNRQKGISLLEVLLSLTIIAIILLMATRYYEITNASGKMNDGVRVLNSLTAAADDWFVTYKTYQAAENIPAISKTALIQMGDLPQEYARDNANPWGGEINISPADVAHVTLELTKVPYGDCLNLKGIMQNRMNVADCPTAGGFKATYPLTTK